MNAQDILEAWDSQKDAQIYNSQEAEKNRVWQEQMYGSRFQRTMQDIRKAGLNPYVLNTFSPGGFGSGGAATIAANVMKNYSENHNTNRKEATAFDWLSPLLSVVGGLLGAMIGPTGAVIGGALGNLTARAITKK